MCSLCASTLYLVYISHLPTSISFFFFNDPPTTEIYTLSLHDALPILPSPSARRTSPALAGSYPGPRRSCRPPRSEEHTSELQSRLHLVCRLLLEKKKKKQQNQTLILCSRYKPAPYTPLVSPPQRRLCA